MKKGKRQKEEERYEGKERKVDARKGKEKEGTGQEAKEARQERRKE